jgi:hypothetical protein
MKKSKKYSCNGLFSIVPYLPPSSKDLPWIPKNIIKIHIILTRINTFLLLRLKRFISNLTVDTALGIKMPNEETNSELTNKIKLTFSLV